MPEKIPSALAPRPSLEYLKLQAKRLLADARAGNPHAVSRLRRAKALPEPAGAAAPTIRLSDAQLTVARENGSGSWTELRAAIASAPPADATMRPGEIGIQGIDQIWLDCADLAAAEDFYGRILGLPRAGGVPGMMTFFAAGPTNLLIGLRAEVRPNSIVYFSLPGTEQAIQSAYNALKATGVRVGDSPHCIARNWQGCDVWMAFFFDPSGNQLAFKANVPVT